MKLTPLGLGIAGVVNLLPIVGVLGRAWLNKLYGIGLTENDSDTTLLMQHRAVLLSVVSLISFKGMIDKKVQNTATALATLSMASYAVIVMGKTDNKDIFKVALVDCGALLVLLGGVAWDARNSWLGKAKQ